MADRRPVIRSGLGTPGAPVVDLWIKGIPVQQGSKTIMPVGRKCHTCGRAQTVLVENTDKRLKAWRGAIVSALVAWRTFERLKAGPAIDPDQPVKVRIVFHFPRPKSHLKKSGELAKGKPHHKISAPDLDKLVRSVHDALTTAELWGDDSRIIGITAGKTFVAPGGEGARITVWEVL